VGGVERGGGGDGAGGVGAGAEGGGCGGEEFKVSSGDGALEGVVDVGHGVVAVSLIGRVVTQRVCHVRGDTFPIMAKTQKKTGKGRLDKYYKLAK